MPLRTVDYLEDETAVELKNRQPSTVDSLDSNDTAGSLSGQLKHRQTPTVDSLDSNDTAGSLSGQFHHREVLDWDQFVVAVRHLYLR